MFVALTPVVAPTRTAEVHNRSRHQQGRLQDRPEAQVRGALRRGKFALGVREHQHVSAVAQRNSEQIVFAGQPEMQQSSD